MYKKILLVSALVLTSVTSFALEVGDDAPCVVLEHIETNGQTSDHCIRDPKIEAKPVVLDFFSIYCHSCIESFPLINQLSAEIPNAATFRAIAIDRNENEVKSFIATRKDLIMHEVGLDSDRSAKKAYGVVSTPTIFVLDTNIKVVFKHEGLVTPEVSNRLKEAILSVK